MKLAPLAFTLLLTLTGTSHAAGPMGESKTESSTMTGVNAAGEWVGEIKEEDGRRRAVLMSQGRRIEIGTLGGSDSTANAINNQGTVTGGALTAGNAWHAFRYDEARGMRDLGTLGGSSSVGTAISEAGHIVGYADTEDGNYHAFVDNGIAMLDLGTFGGKNSYATAVNSNGYVVGAAQLPNGYRRAFLYKPGSGMIELPTLGGRISVATAINEAGIVVGASETADQGWHAFMYDGKRMIDLGAMLSRGSSFANGINANGDVVGTVKIKGHDAPHTFIYRNGRMQLRFGPDSLYVTRDITDDGNVIGATYTGHVLKSGTVNADRLRHRLGWDAWITLLALGSLIVYAGFKAHARIRKGIDFKLMFLSVA
ncbi:HAF repeat-containing protein [Pseudoduganella sp. OTU4001]|uniref:HAF repeat-containing protein n=1 Tax=Pseudoduganella sp. OTU4001 TaxID=3043854 RepID=UPI00313B77FD